MADNHLYYKISKELYLSERGRREQIRQSVSTPVAALAFSVFNVGTLASVFDIALWPSPISIFIALFAAISILLIIAAAFLIIRVELGIYYYDPPDLKELMNAKENIKEHCQDDNELEDKMSDYMAACYDIAYRRYFNTNEKAAQQRTRGLHLIIMALIFLSLSFLLLPFQT